MIWLIGYIVGFLVVFYLAFRMTVRDMGADWFAVLWPGLMALVWPVGWIVVLVVWLMITDFTPRTKHDFPGWLARVLRVDTYR